MIVIKKICVLLLLLSINYVSAQDTSNSELTKFKERNAKRLTYWQLDSLRDKGVYIENFMNCIRVDTLDIATDSLMRSEYFIEIEIVDNNECVECNFTDYKFYKIKINRFLQYYSSDFVPIKTITRIKYLMLPKNIKLKERKKYYMMVARSGSPKYLKYVSIVSPRSIFIDTREYFFVGSFDEPNKELDRSYNNYLKWMKKQKW